MSKFMGYVYDCEIDYNEGVLKRNNGLRSGCDREGSRKDRNHFLNDLRWCLGCCEAEGRGNSEFSDMIETGGNLIWKIK